MEKEEALALNKKFFLKIKQMRQKQQEMIDIKILQKNKKKQMSDYFCWFIK